MANDHLAWLHCTWEVKASPPALFYCFSFKDSLFVKILRARSKPVPYWDDMELSGSPGMVEPGQNTRNLN